MKKVFIAIALTALLSSCNVQKQVTRQDVTASSQSESKEAMASRLKKETKTDATTTTDIRTTESCDTVLNLPGSTLSREIKIRDLISNGTLNLENATVVGTITVDTASGMVILSVTEKPRQLPHIFNRTTVSRETEIKTTKQDENLKATASLSQSNKTSTENSSVSKDIKRSVPWWTIILCFLAIVILAVAIRLVWKRLL